jgi:hypothetical protein
VTTSATVASHLEIGLLENIAKAGEYELPHDNGKFRNGSEISNAKILLTDLNYDDYWKENFLVQIDPVKDTVPQV